MNNSKRLNGDRLQGFETLRSELKAYCEDLMEKPFLTALTGEDLSPLTDPAVQISRSGFLK